MLINYAKYLFNCLTPFFFRQCKTIIDNTSMKTGLIELNRQIFIEIIIVAPLISVFK